MTRAAASPAATAPASSPAWELAAPARIVFGAGVARQAGGIARSLGTRALVVEGRGDRGAALRDALAAEGLGVATHRVAGEPTAAMVEEGTRVAREARCDVVVAMGGGSVLDAAKAIAAMITNDGALRDYLEVVGAGRPLVARAAPMVAMPTTAGTGSEVTRNAVLMVEDARVKVSLRSPLMLPAVALVDPELTRSLPPDVTASTGLDALTQCLEPFVSPAATPLTDAVAREGLRRAATALPRAVRDGGDVEARHDMAVASLCGGLALANARLGAVHGFAAPLGGMFPVPHGVACARLLPPVVAANVRALAERGAHAAHSAHASGLSALSRYDEAARLLMGEPSARAADLAGWLAALVAELRVPSLAAYGVGEGDVAAVVGKARRASSMQGNPVVLTDEELAGALRAAL